MKSISKEDDTRQEDGVSIRISLKKYTKPASTAIVSSSSAQVLANHAKEEPTEAPADTASKEIKGNVLNDPVSFWASWSERQANCEEQNQHGTQTTCNCFEGMGSVM